MTETAQFPLAMGVIADFLARYTREFDYYEQAARICAHYCDERLEQSGVRGIVTYRAKRWDKLRDKLVTRNNEQQYVSIEEVYGDIVDLAGVRIALYFPADRENVVSILNS